MQLKRFRPAGIGLLIASVISAGTLPASAAGAAQPAPASVAEDTATTLAALLDSEHVILDVPTDDGVVIPAEADQGLQVPTSAGARADLTVEIGLPVDATADVSETGAVTYAEPGAPSALVVQAVDVSGEPELASATMALITIAAPEAATEFPFELDLPAGASVQTAEGGAVVVTDTAGSALGVFPRPWAVDAEGRDVPTRFEVRGTSLVQVVEHAGFTYPVVADPVWMVPVILIGGRAAIQVAVRANTATAARTAAARAAAAQSGRGVSSTGAATQLSYRAFTASNYRHNLIVKTGKNPSNCQAHHMIPQKFAAQVGGRVNIHDPANLVWWNSTSGLAGNHQSKAYEYNQNWERFFQRYGANASASQIQAEKNRLDGIYKNLYRC